MAATSSMSEAEYVIDQFRKNFSAYQEEPIAIYGLGANTKVILDAFPEYHIAGLMDEVRMGDRVWGYSVINCEEAYARGVKKILILARTSNISIIYRRIAEECARYHIDIYDINGNRIDREQNVNNAVSMAFYLKNRREVLLAKIRESDVVSFDIFDTLLMRGTLYPKDVFLLVDEKAKAKGILEKGTPFAKMRQVAERELSLTIQPFLHDIYHAMVERGFLRPGQAEMLIQMEIAEEKNQLRSRTGMREIWDYAKEQGKILCCTSNMYLPKEILCEILRENGIEGMDEIFVSCEEGVSKARGLFDRLKDKYPGKRILHIGDNEDADNRAARAYGIDDVFQIHSAFKMLEDSVASKILDFVEELEDRQEIGYFLANEMADPFLFERTKGKLEIRSYYDMGHDFIEPIMAGFLDWMIKQCDESRIDMLMLGARDGWILTKLLDIVRQQKSLSFEYRYIPASRTACLLAGMESEEDVAFAASQAFSGTAQELLQKRFQLKEDEILQRNGTESEQSYILRHTGILLEHGKLFRKNYREALKNLGIEEGQKKAYFDFVSSGTCQFWLEKILHEKLTGFCFVRFLSPRKEELNLQSFLADVLPTDQGSGWRILDNYFLLEFILSAPNPFLLYVGEHREMVYDVEQRQKNQIMNLNLIHQGIQEGFRQRLEAGRGTACSKRLVDFFTGLLQEKYSVADMNDFRNMVVKDEFCNRKFRVD